MRLNYNNLFQIKGDTSKKKIFRFKNDNEKKIVVDFSYNSNDYQSFLNVHNILSKINISIPKIFDVDDINKIIVMEDFGNMRYDRLIKIIDLKEILINAVNTIIEIQNFAKPEIKNILKKYNFSIFESEISEFTDFYFPINYIGNDIANEFFYIWKKEFENLNFKWDSFTHKDFELSNLMYLSERTGHLKCGIIDFQNAFIGFSGWDLFSLLENSRIYFNDKYNSQLVEYFYENTHQKISQKEFLTQYYFLNTARQTRIVGRWINLDKKNKTDHYSQYIYTTIKRLKKSLHFLQNQKLTNLYDNILTK